MDVTVVIPNYNGKDYIKECLDSILTQSIGEVPVIVVDNASADGSDQIIADEYPQVQLIRNKTNEGFSAAVNIGIRAACTKYVILLNNDTKCERTYVEELVKAISKSKKIFSVSSRMVQYKDHTMLDDTGDFYTVFGWAYQRGLDETTSRYNKKSRVFSACAGAAIYRKSVFEEIGYFDEEHFAYLEDVDIGYRGNIYGYKNYYEPKAVVYHIGHASTGERYNEFKVRLAARNTVYLYYKNMPIGQFAINFPAILAGHIVKYLYFKKKGLGKIYLDGTIEGIKNTSELKHVNFKTERWRQYVWIQGSMLHGTYMLIRKMLSDKG